MIYFGLFLAIFWPFIVAAIWWNCKTVQENRVRRRHQEWEAVVRADERRVCQSWPVAKHFEHVASTLVEKS